MNFGNAPIHLIIVRASNCFGQNYFGWIAVGTLIFWLNLRDVRINMHGLSHANRWWDIIMLDGELVFWRYCC